MNNDVKYMRIALELAELGRGRVSPNPLVGCVIVKNDEIIAEGYHQEYGGPHAEVNAISKVENSLTDCTVYITLEPCNHYGKTPPCTDLLIEKRPKRVVIAMEDPNPIVKGNGVNILKSAGIEVVIGVLEQDAKRLNRTFIVNMDKKRPYITAKFATTIDGFVAEPNHESKWISCEESRKDVHILRSKVDAILVGSGTVRYDNPKLNVRMVEGKNPIRIVFASHLLLPLKSYILSDELANDKTLIFCTNDAQNIKMIDQLKNNGIKVKAIKKNEEGKIDINTALKLLLKEYQIGHILLEGGAKLFSSFYDSNLIDEIVMYQSSKIIGSGINPFSTIKQGSLTNNSKFDLYDVCKSDKDIKSIWRRNDAK